MPRNLIHAFNLLVLGILWILLPVIAHWKLMSWTVQAPEMHHRFTMVGIGAALFFNFMLLTLVRMRKSRRILAAKWTALQIVWGILYLLLRNDAIRMPWLKDWLG